MNSEATVTIRTAVVDGPLAHQVRRAAAARANECGLQILTLPQLAARLAGGFALRPGAALTTGRAMANGGRLAGGASR